MLDQVDDVYLSESPVTSSFHLGFAVVVIGFRKVLGSLPLTDTLIRLWTKRVFKKVKEP